jgi:glycosyltransferase involved in cell wall biosynthesis
MRIAHFIDDFSASGGTERVASNLTKLFTNHSYEVPLLFTFPPQMSKPFFDFGNLTSVVVLERENKYLIKEMNDNCKKYNIDLILFHGYHSLMFNQNLQKFQDLEYPIILRTAFSTKNFLKINPKYPILINLNYNLKKFINFHLNLKEYYQRKLEEIASTHRIVTVSEVCKTQMTELFMGNENLQRNIFCAHNPIMLPQKTTSKKQKIVLYVGRLREKKKNSMLIVRAWEVIAKECPEWRLYIIGEGELKIIIRKYIHDHNIPNVQLLSPQKNIQDYYAKSQIVVCTSNSDALPQVLVEGAYYSNALLTTEFDGGYNEIVLNGLNGFVVPKNNLREFINKLLFIMNNEKIRKSMMDASPSLTKKFSPECVIKEWENIISSILKKEHK